MNLLAQSPTEFSSKISATPLRDLSIEIVGNVITQPFSGLLDGLKAHCNGRLTHLPFGQVMQALNDESDADVLIVHADHTWYASTSINDEAVSSAGELVAAAEGWLERNRGVLVLNSIACKIVSPVQTDVHAQHRRLNRINEALWDLAEKHARVHVIDLPGVVLDFGINAVERTRNRWVMQAPYAPSAAKAIAGCYGHALTTMIVSRKKVIVLDADNTLWGGVLGEDGWAGVSIDREYPGIGYWLFQEQLADLKRLGFLLAVVTKNNEDDFLEIWSKRSMPLKIDDFVSYKSNWSEKSENISELARELNLGVESFVFIDDNPFEIAEVGARLPGVECVAFPKGDPEAAVTLLGQISSLESRSLTTEDLEKTDQYKAEFQRQNFQKSASSMDSYLQSLGIKITVSRNNPNHVSRISQLTNKTNQFNLTTKRYSEADIIEFMSGGSVYDFRVSDRFGDMGIVGVVIVLDGAIDTFLMSCRALGRRIESTILALVVQNHAGQILSAQYSPSQKNQMVDRFYDDNGFERVGITNGVVEYTLGAGPIPSHYIEIIND